MARNKGKILIFGGTGYIGSYLVKASIKVGYPTYVYSRPNSSKIDLLNEFHSLGVTTVKGELNEHEKLVPVLKEVDVVISGLGYPQVLDQLEIVEAIKRAGDINVISRFLLSDFGAEENRISVLPPFQQILDNKKKIRRAIEAAGIPYTFVSANCYGAFFVNHLLHPHDLKKDITVYGGGKAKVVLVCEEDIGSYTIRVANDPRTCNSLVIFRPTTSITSQLELIALWEGKMSRKFKKVHVSEEEILNLFKIGLPDPENISISILHSLSVKGLTANFDLEIKIWRLQSCIQI